MSVRFNNRNVFERHAKKIIFFMLLVIIAGLALATEEVLSLRMQPYSFNQGIKRYVKLRETRPLFSEVIVPSQTTMDLADTLVRKGYLFRTDRDGFIIPSKIYDNPQLTLLFLGGSTTECCYVEEKDRFPYLVGRLLEKKTGLRTNSYNGAKGGNTSLHSLDILLNKGIPLKPDIAIAMENVNDLAVLLFEKTFWTKNPYRSPLIEIKPSFKNAMKQVEDGLHMIRDLTIPLLTMQLEDFYRRTIGKRSNTDEFKQARGQKIQVDKARLVREFSMNLQTFINICRAREITPVLMTMSNRLREHPDPLIQRTIRETVEKGLGLDYEAFKDLFDLFNQTIREVAAKNGVLVIDLAQEVPHKKELMYDIVHLNDAGSKYVANIIADKLSPLVTSLKTRSH